MYTLPLTTKYIITFNYVHSLFNYEVYYNLYLIMYTVPLTTKYIITFI